MTIFGIWAQRPTHSASGLVGDGGAATKAEINGPQGIAIDGAKFLYIIEGIGDFIRCVNLKTGLISTIKPKGLLKNNLYKSLEVSYVLFSAELWSSPRYCDYCL